jgi:hypothetical protein
MTAILCYKFVAKSRKAVLFKVRFPTRTLIERFFVSFNDRNEKDIHVVFIPSGCKVV